MDSSSLRDCISSGDDTEEANDLIRRYEANSDLVVFKVESTSLVFRQPMAPTFAHKLTSVPGEMDLDR